MNDENPVEKPERRGSRPTPSENRLKQDRRQTSRRGSGQLTSDSERRVGDRRKHERRIYPKFQAIEFDPFSEGKGTISLRKSL